MLTELALTPDVFDQQRHGDVPGWREKIRSLGRGLFPPSNPCPAIIADLYDGTWSVELGRAIGRAADPGAQGLLKSMRSRLERACVKRPCRGDYPDDEARWIQEARAFDADAPLDRIVWTDQCCQPSDARRCGLSMTEADAFWNGVAGTHTPRMALNEQVALLRPVCLHAGFLSFASPHVYGSGSSDFDFAAELIAGALARPADFPRLELVDIHTKGEADSTARDNHRDFVFRELTRRLGASRPTVRLFFWPKLLERILLAGDVTQGAGGGPTPRTRWAFSLSHVARPALDGPTADPPTWVILHDRDTSRWHARLHGAPSIPGGTTAAYSGDAPLPGSPSMM